MRDICTISDLGSRNRVKVNNVPIEDARPLSDGDIVAVGACVFTVHVDHAADPESSSEVEDITQIPAEVDYQIPIYRTCINCRGMLKREEHRCSHCGTEQNQSFNTIRLWADPHGRRTSYRAPVRMRALYVSAFMTIEGEISDISLGGAFFSTQLLDETGTACDLLVFPTDDSEVVRFSAEVVRTAQGENRGLGVGVRFVKMTSAAQAWLLTVVSPP